MMSPCRTAPRNDWPLSREYSALEADGFLIRPEVFSRNEIAHLVRAVEEVTSANSHNEHREVFALRGLLEAVPATRALATSSVLRKIIAPVLGGNHFAIGGLLFDKVRGANWKVPFHQDLTIAVRKRLEAPGFGPWSVKSGVHHVQPPSEILESLLTVRVHLDDCDAANGALRVLPGSHRAGKLSAEAIQRWRRTKTEFVCPVPAGGVLLMRPLLLHASSPALSPRHRRVLHLEFAAESLPYGLEWHFRVASHERAEH